MADELNGKRIAFLVANSGVEQVELTTPWEAVEKAGGTPVLIAPEKDTVQAFNNDVEKADTFDADVAVGDVSADDFAALVLPGGTTNPDALRLDRTADGVRRRVRPGRQADRRDLSRPVVAGRGRRRPGQDPDQLAEPADRHPQRRRRLAGRRGLHLHRGRPTPW